MNKSTYNSIVDLASDDEKIEKIDGILRGPMYNAAEKQNMHDVTGTYLSVKGAIETIKNPVLKTGVLKQLEDTYTYYRNQGTPIFDKVTDPDRLIVEIVAINLDLS